MFLLIPLPVFYILFRCSSLQYFDGGDDILLLLVLLFFLIDVLEPMFDAIFWEIDSERTCNDQKLIVPHRMYYSLKSYSVDDSDLTIYSIFLFWDRQGRYLLSCPDCCTNELQNQLQIPSEFLGSSPISHVLSISRALPYLAWLESYIMLPNHRPFFLLVGSPNKYPFELKSKLSTKKCLVVRL